MNKAPNFKVKLRQKSDTQTNLQGMKENEYCPIKILSGW